MKPRGALEATRCDEQLCDETKKNMMFVNLYPFEFCHRRRHFVVCFVNLVAKDLVKAREASWRRTCIYQLLDRILESRPFDGCVSRWASLVSQFGGSVYRTSTVAGGLRLHGEAVRQQTAVRSPAAGCQIGA